MFPKATHVHFGKLKNAKSKIPFLYPPELLAVDFFVGVLLDCIYLKKKKFKITRYIPVTICPLPMLSIYFIGSGISLLSAPHLFNQLLLNKYLGYSLPFHHKCTVMNIFLYLHVHVLAFLSDVIALGFMLLS